MDSIPPPPALRRQQQRRQQLLQPSGATRDVAVLGGRLGHGHGHGHHRRRRCMPPVARQHSGITLFNMMMMMMMISMIGIAMWQYPSRSAGTAVNGVAAFLVAKSTTPPASYQARHNAVPPPVSYQEKGRRSLVLFASKKKSSSNNNDYFKRTTPSEDERPIYPKSRRVESAAVAAASASMSQRPGAIIETEEQLEAKARILKEMDDGSVQFKNSEWLQEVFGEVMVVVDDEEEVDDEEDDTSAKDIGGGGGGEEGDDDQLLDANTLGTWTIEDIRSKFDYEWDPNGHDPDPNLVSLNQPSVRYVEEAPKDPDDVGVELGYDPIFGPSSPVDKRTILGAKDSYMVDPTTRDDTRLQPQFARDDPELEFNQEVVEFRQAMDIMETFIDPFLPDMEIPRHVAKWHGYPDLQYFEPKPFTNNRFTSEQDRTHFDQLDPFRARQNAVELARAKNAEWLPSGTSQAFHEKQRAPYEVHRTLVGTLRKQTEPFDEDLLEQIQPALQVFGACVELLSIHDGVFRFHYHGLMKNRHGMTAWMESLLKEECGVDLVTGVVMETGFRQRDAAYDGGDPWYAPIG